MSVFDFDEMPDGWSAKNPNVAECECGSSDIEFNWRHGEPKAWRCLECGDEGWDKG